MMYKEERSTPKDGRPLHDIMRRDREGRCLFVVVVAAAVVEVVVVLLLLLLLSLHIPPTDLDNCFFK